MAELKGLVAVVTGAGSGIGRATAAGLHAAGASLALIECDGDAGRRVATTLSGGPPVLLIEADATVEEQIISSAERIRHELGAPEILVNNAARFIMKGVDASAADWRASLEANVVAYALWIKHLAPYLAANGRGAVVNVSSISAHIAQPGFQTYSASKAAVSMVTKCMALDLAPAVRVNSVAPGTIWSESNARFINETYGFGRVDADRHPDLGGRHVLRRLGDPEEVANAVVFLCSAKASFITGTELLVDGGYLLQ